MRQIKDYSGVRIGQLTGLFILKKENNKIYWKLKCDCGESVIKTSRQLVESNRKKNLKMMCDLCKLNTFKRPTKSKLFQGKGE